MILILQIILQIFLFEISWKNDFDFDFKSFWKWFYPTLIMLLVKLVAFKIHIVNNVKY